MAPEQDTSHLSTADVGRTRLENGLVALTRESHSSPTVSCMIWYRVGSRNEKMGETGRSHFLEHMMFKGTKRFEKGEIDLLTMKNGGSNNAFTSYDFTAYYFNFASDRWETAIEIESDRMVNTVFEPSEFEAERQVIIEELKGRLDQPWGHLMQELNATAYHQHPYRNPVIGWLEDVESATLEGMEAYYRQYYHPSNATLVLVGDFQTHEALEKVQAAFGDIPTGEVPTVEGTAEPRQLAERRFELEWRSEIPRMGIGYHTPGIGHRDSYALQLLAVILAEGKASRLYQRMVQREQAATFVTAEYGESAEPTLFYIRAEAREGSSIEAIEKSIFDELGRIVSSGVDEHELERAKHQVEAHFIFSMERTLDQAMLLGQIETLDELDYIDQYLSRIWQVDADRVSAVCELYLSESNRTVGWQGSQPTLHPERPR